MKALALTRYGGPEGMKILEGPKPQPREDQVLIRVMAAGVNAADNHLLKGPIPRLMGFGLLSPRNRIWGSDAAGIIEAVGKRVTAFQPGDEVLADLSGSGHGAFAEYVCAPEKLLVKKPANLSFEQAASLPMASVTALQALRDRGKLQAGQRVLVHGAAGGVGSFAVQIAKALGAHVTAVARGARREEILGLGADRFIAYDAEDFVALGETWDLILGVNGDRKLQDYAQALAPGGTYVMVGGAGRQISEALFRGPFLSRKGGKQFLSLMAEPRAEDLVYTAGLAAEEKMTPQVWKVFPLHRGAEALTLLKEGHSGGKIILKVGD